MEDAFRAGGLLEKAPTRLPKETNPLAKKADVDLIVRAISPVFRTRHLILTFLFLDDWHFPGSRVGDT